MSQCEKHPDTWDSHSCPDCSWGAGFLGGIIVTLVAVGVAILIFKLMGGHI